MKGRRGVQMLRGNRGETSSHEVSLMATAADNVEN